jgi:DNA gyrase subunit A
MLEAFIRFREEVITKRTKFELTKARDRAHILVGLAIAVANIEAVIALIRKAPDPSTAREELMARSWPIGDLLPLLQLVDEPDRIAEDATYMLSEAQARAILALTLQRLTGLERTKISDELREVTDQIQGYLALLESRDKLYALMRSELVDIKTQFATPRRTEIRDNEFEQDIEDLIQREDMVVTVTHAGYIKRVPVSAYRSQRRGGKGRSGMATHDEDFVENLFVVNTHTPVLFFSSRGMVYKMKVYRLPLGTPQARGRALVNLLPLSEGETITTLMPMPEDEQAWAKLSVMLATQRGNVRRNQLSDFVNVNVNGKIAMKFEGEDEGDRLIAVQVCSDDQDVLLATRAGKAIRFPVADVRVFASRSSTGVRGIRLAESDEVISMSLLNSERLTTEERDAYLRQRRLMRQMENGEEENAGGEEEVAAEMPVPSERFVEMAEREEIVLTVASSGFGKRTSAYDYRITARGGKGIDLMDLGRGDAEVVAAFPVRESDQVMLVTDGGQLIRIAIHDIRMAGRTTRGVKLFSVGEGERVVSVTRISAEEEVEESVESGGK